MAPGSPCPHLRPWWPVSTIYDGRGALDVGAPAEQLVPELAGTCFAGATVRDLLDMRAGTRFDEDYTNPEADPRQRAGVAICGLLPSNLSHPGRS
jgi:CubicO group peptidase (beta-lactamase class C family)